MPTKPKTIPFGAAPIAQAVVAPEAPKTIPFGAAPIAQPKKQDPGLVENLTKTYTEGVGNMLNSVKDIGSISPIAPFPGGRQFLRTVGPAGRAVGDVVESGIKTGVDIAKKIIPQPIQDGLSSIFTPVKKAASEVIAPVYGAGKNIFDSVEKNFPETAQDIKDTIGAANIEGATAFKKPIEAIAKSLIPEVTEASAAAKASARIASDFNKGVEPLFSGTTKSQLEKKTAQTINAVKLIQQNKPNLKFVDELGETVTGRTPNTVTELSDALDQTKRTIFNTYNGLAKTAGDRGLSINPKSISEELNTIAESPALKLSNPEAASYAKAVQERYANVGELTPEVVQDVIKNLNESLKAFYAKPSYTEASRATIDAIVANNLRRMLDEGVEKLTGTQYQAIKDQYASLKAIEKDVVRAASRQAKKGNKGLIDYTDIFTGADAVQGLLTLNPTAIARGFAGRGIKEFYKYLNDPNRAIQSMFKNAEKLPDKNVISTPTKQTPLLALPAGGTYKDAGATLFTTRGGKSTPIKSEAIDLAAVEDGNVKKPKTDYRRKDFKNKVEQAQLNNVYTPDKELPLIKFGKPTKKTKSLNDIF